MGKACTVGVGMVDSPASKSALRWTVENLLDNGDTLILIHVQPKKDERKGKILFGDTAQVFLEEFIEVKIPNKYGVAYDDEVLAVLHTLNKAKPRVKVAAKVYWGDPKEKLCDAVESLKLDSIVVGSRGLGLLQRMLHGSVSNHVVTNVACPVTVVKAN